MNHERPSPSPAAPSASIEPANLALIEASRAFGPRRVLDGASLRIPGGSSVAIMGRSGSGKSTLLHVLAGIDLPDAGRVVYDGLAGKVVVSSLSESERTTLRLHAFGFVFQQGMLLPDLTARENVALPLLLAGRAKTDALAVADERLAAVGLAGYGDRRPGQLSGGEAQRVAIARAIATGPRVVFADEPTASLDTDTSGEVVDELLRATTAQGRTLVVVTHDRGVAERCDRIVWIRDGRIEDDRGRA